MIQHLTIKNYALIDELELDLSGGMTIITGETGAGKSILLGALSLLLGSRADLSALYSKDLKCVIEGTFNTADYELGAFFGEHDIDIDPVTIIRREIGKDGKSRAFINDTPVNLSVLKELGSRLIEIHSQHETLTLNNSGFQMMVLDSCAGSAGHLEAYRKVYKDYNHSLELLGQLKERESKAASEQDYLQFQFDELESAQLKQGEKEAMEKELELLNNSESISLSLSRASEIINGDQDNILRAVSSVVTSLQPVATFHTGVEDILKRLRSLQIELKDIASELDVVAGSVSYDPVRAEIVSDRLDLIYRLEQKHRLQTVEELIALKDSISEKLLSFSSLGDEIEKTEKLCSRLLSELEKHAGKLSANRHKAVEGIEQQVQKTLSNLGMKHAVLKIDLQSLPKGQFRDSGTDTVEFLFSANKGIEYRELSKVASGGELSRLMLSIKSILASLRGLPTIIFDEIDTGISGEVAHKVGNILKSMSKERQVIAITHLPQMAGKGDSHLYVYKNASGAKTVTRIRQLTPDERVEEIARMLSGEKPSAAAKANARELLQEG
jgi:DNA repair protein RecN (Recombination protein N)